jgi:hypothetical protein
VGDSGAIEGSAGTFTERCAEESLNVFGINDVFSVSTFGCELLSDHDLGDRQTDRHNEAKTVFAISSRTCITKLDKGKRHCEYEAGHQGYSNVQQYN